MTSGPEWDMVERPLLEHLAALGWETLIWSERRPSHQVDRSSGRDVILEKRLAHVLKRINPGPDGQAWLDDTRIRAAISELKSTPPGTRLFEANQRSTELLLKGVTVDGLDGWVGGKQQTVDFIDWDNWSANDFLAVSQFRVATPGQAPNIRPDVTLFVNGIPLVVIEAKPPGPANGIADAINQLRRYANRRNTETPEGAEQLFRTNQFTVATTGERAEAATFTADPEHYMAWKDPFPSTPEEVAESLDKPVETVTQQELLTAGMLAPDRLLDIVRHFTLFMETPGRSIKIVARYQQYRGVHQALQRLLTGTTKAENGQTDQRGGIIWHTQGSGKSLTMAFLVRAMRSHPQLRRFKIVLVTDRKNLQNQLQKTAQLAGEAVKVARTVNEVEELVSPPGPGLVMVMIQKMGDLSADENEGIRRITEPMNESESILVMVDEAHRSHSSVLHANLMAALPNAARIGFTGTPIIMGQRTRTFEIFGDYLDQYKLGHSEADGSTVPILYEGRFTDAAVRGASQMDEIFDRWFSDLTKDERRTLQQKFATVPQVLEAPELIEAKARDLLIHYVRTVMPGGFKGMVVASSRKACHMYYQALNQARDDLVGMLRPDNHHDSDGGPSIEVPLWAGEITDSQIDLLENLDFAPVISGTHNDPPEYAPWTGPHQPANIDRFKRPLGPEDDGRHSPLALVIVKSMLLTGFDAPLAQVLYLDRSIKEAELLQAVARVNRTARHKKHGLVVDYYGVSTRLQEALAVYADPDGNLIEPDVENALRSLALEIEKLEPRKERVRQIFVQHGIEPAADPQTIEDCVQLLGDERLRAEFDLALQTFFATVDTVLPRPEALPFIKDVEIFGEIQVATRRRYRDTPDGDFDPYKYQEKVRRLIDKHITVLDLSQRVAPLLITDPYFTVSIDDFYSGRTKASEMEHALRHHIRSHIEEDPAYYAKLSERLDHILEQLEEQWDQLAFELEELTKDVKAGRQDVNQTGLDPITELPFHNLMADKVADHSSATDAVLIELTSRLVDMIRRMVGVVGFWDNPIKQDDLRKAIKLRLDDSSLFDFADLDELSSELVAIAKANQHHLN
ncbi:MAG: HsdR family type I site-specific deoxyribonuclease [Acidimicrobiia bacterium]|nr:HsdR family type I site-specific deoxyribonuclease [Acidimicrobiia bacterium]